MTHIQEKANRLFQQGIIQAKAGDKRTARKYLQQVVSLNPKHEAAWLYLAGIAEEAESAAQALKQVQRLNPTNPHLEKARDWLKQKWPEYNPKTPEAAEPEQTKPPQQKSGKLTGTVVKFGAIAAAIMLSLVVVSLSIFQDAAANFVTSLATATPTKTTAQELTLLNQQLQQAQEAANQPAMIAALKQMLALTPEDPKVKRRLAELYYEQGMILRNGGNFEEAKRAFERAFAVWPNLEAASAERELVTLYLAGVKHHQQAEWAEAVTVFEKIYAQMPTYPYIDEILYSSYFNLGLVKGQEGALKEALKSYQQAAQILPNAPEAPRKIKEVSFLLTPPTPTPTATPATPPTPTPLPKPKKRVEVDISEQRAYVYEGDKLVYKFVVSTGEPGRDTAIGQFEILNKIPMAYASTWNLDMPYWLGIYWSGSLQNGFHALPTVRHTGQMMWDGYLGQRVSYGCIILSYYDAKTLYNWVDIGTPVVIRN